MARIDAVSGATQNCLPSASRLFRPLVPALRAPPRNRNGKELAHSLCPGSALGKNSVRMASLEMFAALQAGAHFGYLDWFATLALATLGNMIGGVGLVTLLRLVQVGRAKIEQERQAAEAPTVAT
jgi:hypothetical protein